MLDIKVYSERSYVSDGITTHVGEDAHPYINEAGMFVADGLGGGAAIHIDAFPEWCFDPDNLSYEICEASCLESSEAKAALADYVKSNFASLANETMRKIYESPDHNRLRFKKSGYVGSHVLGNIMAGYLLEMKEKRTFAKAEWEADLRRFADQLPDLFREEIQSLGPTLSDVRINRGIDYYGTTLSAAFFRENKDTVDIIFINCGDSRSYVLDRAGFRQACEDQSRNGVMTSKISLGNRTSVNIEFKKKTYKKPVTVMCVTDGAYEIFCGRNGCPTTPLCMEGYLLKTISDADSLEKFKSRLQKTFDERGLMDDSNSMVMASFGYASYDEFREEAKKRLDDIDHKYGLNTLPPDILVEPYERKRKNLKAAMQQKQTQLVHDLFSEKRIHDECVENVKSAAMMQRYCPDYTEIANEINSLQASAYATRNKCISLLRRNWLDFDNGDTKTCPPTIILPGRNFDVLTNKALAAGESYTEDTSKRNEKLEQLSNLLSVGFTGNAENEGERLISCKSESSTEFLNSIEAVRIGVLKTTEAINRTIEDIKRLTVKIENDRLCWNEINCKLAMTWYDNEAIAEAADRLLTGQIYSKDGMPEMTIDEARAELAQYIADHNNITGDMVRKEMELYFIQEMAAESYWEEFADYSLIQRLYEHQAFEDDDLRERVRCALEQNKELAQCELMLEKQKTLFDEYLDMHLAEMSSAKHEDVRKHGWI